MSEKWDTQLEGITAQAVEWFARMRESELSVEDRARFEQWIAESPLHVREYLGAAELWGTMQASDGWPSESTEELLAQARATANVVSFPSQGVASKDSQPPARSRKSIGLAIAATVLLMLGIAGIGLLPESWWARETLATSLGEQRSVVLADGSVIQLNTLTRIRVRFDDHRRLIELSQGEAFFRVAHDEQRPFEVVTAFGTVRAVGTEFNVYSRAHDMRVAVVEGKVRVSANSSDSGRVAPPTLVTARQSVQIVAGAAAAVRLPTSEPQLATAWMQRRLAFENDSLADVVTEFNRYNRLKLRIDDDELAALEINGVFNADDPHALIGYLQRVQRVVVEEAAGDSLVLRRSKE
jgi:transmembrane sensor